MPLTAYLRIGDIAGESQQVDHEDEIDIYDISWGLEHGSPSSGRLRSRARTDVGPLTIRKHYDASSPYIAEAVDRGKRFKELVVTVSKQTDDNSLDYLIITMENVVISSYAFGEDDDGILGEEMEIDFKSVTLKYTVLNENGIGGAEHEVQIGS